MQCKHHNDIPLFMLPPLLFCPPARPSSTACTAWTCTFQPTTAQTEQPLRSLGAGADIGLHWVDRDSACCVSSVPSLRQPACKLAGAANGQPMRSLSLPAVSPSIHKPGQISPCNTLLPCLPRLRGEFSERRRQAVEAVYEAKPMPQVRRGGSPAACVWAWLLSRQLDSLEGAALCLAIDAVAP